MVLIPIIKIVNSLIRQLQDTWSTLINSGKFTYNDLDMMINTFHNSNTSKDNHPLYFIVNRHQCLDRLNKKDIFNKYNFNINLKIKT